MGGYPKVQSTALIFHAKTVSGVWLNNVSAVRGCLPGLFCLHSAELSIWASSGLLKTLRCEDWYPYPMIREQTCHRATHQWERQGTDSAIGGSISCPNCQSLFRIKQQSILPPFTLMHLQGRLPVCRSWVYHAKIFKNVLCVLFLRPL